EDVIKGLAIKARSKGLELLLTVHPGIPASMVGDPTRLSQILTNLVGNALKFTDRGEVVVEVRKEVESDNFATLHFNVGDTGIGIPLEKQQMIFDEFSQEDSSTTRRFGGTGLGLAISKRLVGMMGGQIWLERDRKSVGEGKRGDRYRDR